MSAAASISALLLRVGKRTCALKLPEVLEIMRPLPVETMAGADGPCRRRGLRAHLPDSVIHEAAQTGLESEA